MYDSNYRSHVLVLVKAKYQIKLPDLIKTIENEYIKDKRTIKDQLLQKN